MITDGPEISATLRWEVRRWTRLLAGLELDDLRRPTRCDGWAVIDVLAHVIGRFDDIAGGRFDGLGDPATVEAHRRRWGALDVSGLRDRWQEAAPTVLSLAQSFSPSDLEAPAFGDFNGTFGQAIEFLAQELWVHGDDVRHARGEAPEPSPGASATVSRFVRLSTEVQRPPVLFLVDGRHLVGIGDCRTSEPIHCSLVELALVGTGRGDRASLGIDERYDLYYPDDQS